MLITKFCTFIQESASSSLPQGLYTYCSLWIVLLPDYLSTRLTPPLHSSLCSKVTFSARPSLMTLSKEHFSPSLLLHVTFFFHLPCFIFFIYIYHSPSDSQKKVCMSMHICLSNTYAFIYCLSPAWL